MPQRVYAIQIAEIPFPLPLSLFRRNYVIENTPPAIGNLPHHAPPPSQPSALLTQRAMNRCTAVVYYLLRYKHEPPWRKNKTTKQTRKKKLSVISLKCDWKFSVGNFLFFNPTSLKKKGLLSSDPITKYSLVYTYGGMNIKCRRNTPKAMRRDKCTAESTCFST